MQLFSQGRLPSREELHDRLDTNVLIYACDKADPARQDRAESDFEHHSGVRLWQVACEFIAASRKLERQVYGSERRSRCKNVLVNQSAKTIATLNMLEQ